MTASVLICSNALSHPYRRRLSPFLFGPARRVGGRRWRLPRYVAFRLRAALHRSRADARRRATASCQKARRRRRRLQRRCRPRTDFVPAPQRGQAAKCHVCYRLQKGRARRREHRLRQRLRQRPRQRRLPLTAEAKAVAAVRSSRTTSASAIVHASPLAFSRFLRRLGRKQRLRALRRQRSVHRRRVRVRAERLSFDAALGDGLASLFGMAREMRRHRARQRRLLRLRSRAAAQPEICGGGRSQPAAEATRKRARSPSGLSGADPSGHGSSHSAGRYGKAGARKRQRQHHERQQEMHRLRSKRYRRKLASRSGVPSNMLPAVRAATAPASRVNGGPAARAGTAPAARCRAG